MNVNLRNFMIVILKPSVQMFGVGSVVTVLKVSKILIQIKFNVLDVNVKHVQRVSATTEVLAALTIMASKCVLVLEATMETCVKLMVKC